MLAYLKADLIKQGSNHRSRAVAAGSQCGRAPQ